MLQRLNFLPILKKLTAPLLAMSLLLSSGFCLGESTMTDTGGEQPGSLRMYTDLLFLRPIGLALTTLGTAAYIVSLPFTLPLGCSSDAGKTLVVEPVKFTFYRCLGCAKTGNPKTHDVLATKSSEDSANAGAAAEKIAVKQ